MKKNLRAFLVDSTLVVVVNVVCLRGEFYGEL